MTDKHIIIIAEAGVNHNGDIDMARRMVAEARKAGADYVKFQTAVPELVISTFAPKAEYQKATTGEAGSQLEMCKAIHLPLSDYAELKALCDEAGIGFMSRSTLCRSTASFPWLWTTGRFLRARLRTCLIC